RRVRFAPVLLDGVRRRVSGADPIDGARCGSPPTAGARPEAGERTGMSRRTLVGAIASAAFGGILLLYLLLRADVDLAQIERLVLGLRPERLAEVSLLLGFNSLLAGKKWRLIDRHLGDPGRPAMPRLNYFAFTAIGVGLGQIVPAQLSLALCRSLGAHLYGGRGFMRGATATLFDQFFDLL